MQAYLLESFLVRYYLLSALLYAGGKDDGDFAVYNELSRLFCLSDKEVLQTYREASAAAHFEGIRDKASYARFCRILEFGEKSGQDMALDDTDRRILRAKREAMNILQSITGDCCHMTEENVIAALSDKAHNGNVHAMTALSYLEYHGIFTLCDKGRALSRIAPAARWNDLFACLMGVAYGQGSPTPHCNRLYTVLSGASGQRVLAHILKAVGYTEPLLQDADAKLLEKAFAMGIVKRDSYDRAFGKVAFSDMITARDKEKLLLTRQKEVISALSEIPFDAKDTPPMEFDRHSMDTLALVRPNEQARILRHLTVANRCAAVARALLVSCDDPYLADMYADMFTRGFAGQALFPVDARALTDMDFAPGKENILLRGLAATKSRRTVFLFTHVQDLPARHLPELLKMLDVNSRRRFKLYSPNVSPDLSGLQFILVCDKRSGCVKDLCRACDTVTAKAISSEEKEIVLGQLFSLRQHCFGCEDVQMDSECRGYLMSYDTERVVEIIDGALGMALYDRSDRITLSMVKTVVSEERSGAPKNQFGYTGGNYA